MATIVANQVGSESGFIVMAIHPLDEAMPCRNAKPMPECTTCRNCSSPTENRFQQGLKRALFCERETAKRGILTPRRGEDFASQKAEPPADRDSVCGSMLAGPFPHSRPASGLPDMLKGRQDRKKPAGRLGMQGSALKLLCSPSYRSRRGKPARGHEGVREG